MLTPIKYTWNNDACIPLSSKRDRIRKQNKERIGPIAGPTPTVGREAQKSSIFYPSVSHWFAPRRSGRSRFSSTSRASVPSSIKSSLVMTPMVRSPANRQKFLLATVLRHGRLAVSWTTRPTDHSDTEANQRNVGDRFLTNLKTRHFKVINLIKVIMMQLATCS